ncbi:SRPBCC domain-containing protein [Leifsonia sp. ZF2019]|uniref:SRPBCC domain-containing protein n=1 Tax=Leifsonia sp. ZF2019 TaxID=2781978 RepID=UPI001CBFF6D2|nr:SRPBCC domain-containing protein [Leifsonia sp. ZF2019]UAJ80223.1 SRPBCC domain-containing protein [Leifsonia sp. ZF2019]
MATENAAAVADIDELTVRRTIRISAPREKVWAAVIEPAHISRWFAATELDAEGQGSITFEGYGTVPLRVAAIAPQDSVTYLWNNDDNLDERPPRFDESRATRFTFTLADAPGGTQLTVVESGFGVTTDPAGNVESHREGWTQELDKLVALLEDGVELAGARA